VFAKCDFRVVETAVPVENQPVRLSDHMSISHEDV